MYRKKMIFFQKYAISCCDMVNLQICMSLGFSWEQQILHVHKVAAGMCLLLQNCAAKGPLKHHTHSNKTQNTDRNVYN